jgi:hypothetical protein
MTTQTLAEGSTLAEKYGKFGVRGPTEVVKPSKMFGAVVGEGGVGKTTLFLQHPGALLLNFDLHSVPRHSPDAPPPVCAFWPVVNSNGMPLDEKGNPFKLAWTHVDSLVTRLLRAAADDKPRPDTIVVDTLYPTVRLKQEAYALSKGYDSWNDTPDGNPRRKAYGQVYDSYVDFVMKLRYAGYGVFLVAHLLTQYYETSDGTDIRISHNIPDKIFGRLFPLLEFLGAIELTWEKQYPVDPETGKKKFDTKNVKKIPVRHLVNLSERLSQEMSRARVALPERIPLEPGNEWPTFEAAYLKAAGAQSAEQP